jgi:hypothetical protein
LIAVKGGERVTVNEIGASTYVKNEVGMLIGYENETKSHDSFFNVFMLALEGIAGEIADTKDEEELAKYMVPMFVPVNHENQIPVMTEGQPERQWGELEEVNVNTVELDIFPRDVKVQDFDVEVSTKDKTFDDLLFIEDNETEVFDMKTEALDVRQEPKEVFAVDIREGRWNVTESHTIEEKLDISNKGVEKNDTETYSALKAVNKLSIERPKEIRLQRDKEYPNVERFDIGIPQNALEVENENLSVSRSHVVESMNRITETIVESISRRETEDNVELTIKLKPEFLGEVEITLEESNGKVKAFLKISNEDLRDALNQRVVEIETALRNQGIEMDKIEFGSFAFQFDTESTGGQGRQGSYKQPSFGYHAERKDALDEESNVFHASGRINYLV